MKKIQIKKAFSLPELLIVMIIIGFISVMMLTIIKPNEKALKYQYFNAYNALSTAAFNINQDAIKEREINDPSVAAEDKTFPQNANALCKKLAVDPNNATSKYGYINTTIYNCSNATPTISKNATKASFTDNNMAFMSSNSMKYYITEMDSSVISSSLGSNANLSYFIVWVDLNGKRNPNTPDWSNNKLPDIVPFLVTNYGSVVPLGNPIVDRRYLIARTRVVTEERTYYTAPTTFYQAQIQAYGNNQYPSTDVLSIRQDWKTLFSGTKIIPHSYPAASMLTECQPPVGSISPCSVLIDEYK